MLGIVGTVPYPDLPLLAGEAELRGERILIQGREIPVNRGTPALLAAAIKTSETLGQGLPFAYLAGDTGKGQGSRAIYEYLAAHLGRSQHQALTFHYLLPDVDWHNRVLFAVEEMPRRPVLVADAGFMYVAKMSGLAPEYDLFTPDVGEMAFLADEEAPHPFYTRGFILHEDNRVEELIERAFRHGNAARCLLVKGKEDYVADQQGVLARVDTPMVEALEAIGGTGDTLTGIVSALVQSGMAVNEAALIGAKANRLAGLRAQPTPATQVFEIIRSIPEALDAALAERGRPKGLSGLDG